MALMETRGELEAERQKNERLKEEVMRLAELAEARLMQVRRLLSQTHNQLKEIA